jgi:hypothetical protein
VHTHFLLNGYSWQDNHFMWTFRSCQLSVRHLLLMRLQLELELREERERKEGLLVRARELQDLLNRSETVGTDRQTEAIGR